MNGRSDNPRLTDEIRSIADMRNWIEADRRSRLDASFWRPFLFDPVFRFTVALRVNSYLVNAGWPFVLRALPLWHFRRLSVRLGFSVPVNVFGPGLAIVHYGLLVVHPEARIGRNCRIHAGVNIGGAGHFGARAAGDDRRLAPTIGDNCYIGPGAKLFGPITIGHDCVIGANAVVNKSFDEDNLTLAGVPAKVVSRKGSAGLLKQGAETSR